MASLLEVRLEVFGEVRVVVFGEGGGRVVFFVYFYFVGGYVYGYYFRVVGVGRRG